MAAGTGKDTPERLLRRALDGDTAAFWELMRGREQMVYAVAVGITRDGDAAAEVAHDVYLRAFSTLGSLRSVDALGGWLYAMTRNLAHERHRREVRQERIRANAPPQQVISVPDMLMKEEEFARMQAAMDELPEAHRIVLGLKYANGMKCHEIAETLGIGMEAAKSRLFEARRALRARMAAAERPAASSGAREDRSEQNARHDGGQKQGRTAS